MSLNSLHDALITGMHFSLETTTLVLYLRLPSGSGARVFFDEAYAWDLAPFERENVISRLTEVPEYAPADPGPTPEMVEALQDGTLRCYELLASVGMDGYIAARAMRVERF